MEDVICAQEISLSVQSLVDNNRRMCRQCFNAFEKAPKVWESLKSGVLDACILTNAPSTSKQYFIPPASKRSRLFLKSSGESPDVNVIHYFIILLMFV